MNWLEEIKRYQPYTPQEEKDKEKILAFCENHSDVLSRENEIGHFSSSAFVVNEKRNKVLMIYHLIYKTYAWTGGHMDGDDDFAYVAKKETVEETGIEKLKLISGIISLESLPVPTHIKGGKEIEEHDHFNVTYLFEADENQELKIKEDENSDVRWIPFEEIEKWVTEKKMIPIYKKIIQRLRELKVDTENDMIDKVRWK